MGKQARKSSRSSSARARVSARRPTLTPAFRRIQMEIMTAEPDMLSETAGLRAVRRFVTEGFGASLSETRAMVATFVSVTEDFKNATENFAASLSLEPPWECSPATIQTALNNMLTAEMPPQIVDAIRAAQLPEPDAPSDISRIDGYLPDPEPAPTDCMHCNEPFDRGHLVECNARGCGYLRCMTCIVRCGGGACPRQGCMLVHTTCPECEHHWHLKSPKGGHMQLNELPPDLLVVSLDNVRKCMQSHISKSLASMREAHESMTAQFEKVIDDMGKVQL